jgi:hypothetical protein
MPSSFRENRLQDWVSEVQAVGIHKENNEDVKCVRELLQGGIDIRQGETGETSKPVRSCVSEFGREFVAPPRQNPSFGVISSVHAGRTQRSDGNVDTGVTHERGGCFLGPAKRRKPPDVGMRVLRLLPEKVGQYVVMGVDGQRCIEPVRDRDEFTSDDPIRH